MNEIWKDIPGYEGKYQVSNLGRVKSLNYHRTGKEELFTPWKNRYGYLLVSLRKDKKKTSYLVHRLVWEAFNGPIPPGIQVNHLDECKTRNSLDNLELATPKENANWGTRNERIGNKVAQLDTSGKLVNIFNTAREAEKSLNILGTSIIACCRNRENHKRAGGYKWRYVKDIHPFVLRLLKDVYLQTPLFAHPSSVPSSCTRT